MARGADGPQASTSARHVTVLALALGLAACGSAETPVDAPSEVATTTPASAAPDASAPPPDASAVAAMTELGPPPDPWPANTPPLARGCEEYLRLMRKCTFGNLRDVPADTRAAATAAIEEAISATRQSFATMPPDVADQACGVAIDALLQMPGCVR